MNKAGSRTISVNVTQLLVLALVILGIGFMLGSQYADLGVGGSIPADAEEELLPVYQAYARIQEDYINDVEADTLINGAVDGMVRSLDDQYSNYLPPTSYQQLDASLAGDMEGIGVTIRTNPDTDEIEVINVIEGAPAEDAGVQAGDVFVEVNGEDVTGLSQIELASRVRGPEGSEVTITFRRDGELIDITVERGRFEVPTISSRVIEDTDIAYIAMSDFNSRSREQLNEAFEEVNIEARSGLILDLRGNPGGLLSGVIDVTSAFVQDSVILYEEFGDGREEAFRTNGSYAGIDLPMVVLVNGHSASASELMAGALQETETATVIGETTFGKGTVQTVIQLANDGGMRLTVARWLTPDRNSIAGQGIEPDIEVPIPEDFNFEEQGDIQLQAAVEHIQSQLGEDAERDDETEQQAAAAD